MLMDCKSRQVLLIFNVFNCQNGKIIYSPLPEEPTLSVSASIQKRNILAVRLNRQAKRATVIGPIATHYAFRGILNCLSKTYL